MADGHVPFGSMPGLRHPRGIPFAAPDACVRSIARIPDEPEDRADRRFGAGADGCGRIDLRRAAADGGTWFFDYAGRIRVTAGSHPQHC
ncbi:Uncharacterized protein pbN1_02680 [Aromatoleum bremense]|nr:Uncharacterized protein pbN1_02680 [Aromatoleum bremense]